MEESLQAIGLTPAQIEAYVYLLDNGQTTPPQLGKQLGVTRTNAYKLLDRLVELGLASRRDIKKKLTYLAEDPIALSDLLAAERNKLLAMEHGVKQSMHVLRGKYREQTAKTEVKAYYGKARIKQMYEQQVALAQPIHFVSTKADIPAMGYETMNYVRGLVRQYGQQRFGIVVDTVGAPTDPAIDERTHLTRTWLPSEEYDAPVEWSASGDELTIFVFEKQGSAIRIQNAAVADAFRQLWGIMDKHLRADPVYETRPRKASRTV